MTDQNSARRALRIAVLLTEIRRLSLEYLPTAPEIARRRDEVTRLIEEIAQEQPPPENVYLRRNGRGPVVGNTERRQA